MRAAIQGDCRKFVHQRRRPGRSWVVERLEDRLVPAGQGISDGSFGYEARAHPYEPIDLEPGQPGVIVIIDRMYDDVNDAPDGTGLYAQSLYGNTFTFHKTPVSRLYVSENGYFRPDIYSPFAINPLKDNWRVNLSDFDNVLGKLDDTNADGRADRLILEWSKVQHAPYSPSSVTFQAILELNTGDRPGAIVFNYRDLDAGDYRWSNGASAKVGIDRIDGIRFNVLTIPTASGLIGSGQAIRIARSQLSVVQFSTARYGVNETDGSATITVTRSGDTSGAVDVFYRTFGCIGMPGYATPWSDYLHTSGWLHFNPGETMKIFTVPIVDDRLVEGNEKLFLDLFSPTGSPTLGNLAHVTLTILDDDVAVIGRLFQDTNGNRMLDANETPLQGWTVYHDSNNNGQWDAGEASMTTDPAGTYRLVTSAGGPLRIRVARPTGWSFTGWDSYTLYLLGGQTAFGADLGLLWGG